MKQIIICFFFPFLFFSAGAQDKIVINDQAGLLNENIERGLKERLEKRGLEYTSLVNFNDRCAYYFATLRRTENDAILQLKDCDDNRVGSKSLGNNFLNASDEESSVLLSFAIMDIIDQKGDIAVLDKKVAEPMDQAEEESENLADLENEHNSRYFFAPSAFNLREGELYYNTLYFFLHDVQYGISDNFSFGMGTTLIGMPFYLTPKISIPLSEKSTLAIGDMMILGTWGLKFFGNLFYGIYTHGNDQNNISVGAGWFATNDNDVTVSDNSLVFNLSALIRSSDFVYLVTENYGFQLNTQQTAWYDDYNETTFEYRYFEESYQQRQRILYGLTGLRFVNKRNNFSSWQFGLTYIMIFYEKIPSRFGFEPWYTSATDGGSRFVAVPTVSYTLKFGKKY